MTTERAQRHPRIITVIVQQHVDDAAFIHSTRSALVRAPHIRLRKLREFDDRLAAHLEGLRLAGDAAKPLCDVALETAGSGAVFVAAIRALEGRDSASLRYLFALGVGTAECRRGLLSAFGWSEREQLRGIVAALLTSAEPFARQVALAACGQHRVDPGLGSARLLEDADPATRARAYRTAGELGKREFVSRLGAAINEEDISCQFWAAWSAVLLGDRHGALEMLKHFAATPGLFRARAFQLELQAMSMEAGHTAVQSLERDPAGVRLALRGAGLVGDPAYIPWLADTMREDKLARLAGEAFSLITGIDETTWLDLERKRPDGFESGPNDDPNDPNVEMDEDDGLPWPDQKLIQAWWNANSHRFQPGVRYFMGEPLNRDNCLRVLKAGFQRQRIAAALYLALLNPGTPLFEWRAPAWRQQHLLAQMS